VKTHPEFPFIVVSPQCPEGEIWSKELLLALLDEVVRTRAVDTNRVYLTGLSMGGYGTWNLGLSHPERFAAIVPICGGGEMISILLAHDEKALKSLGVWAFHGGKDPVVPVEESQRMVQLLKRRGVTDVKLTIYPEAGHDSWTEAYNDPELYKWLLAHQRQPAGK
jgi:predicted peptidase